MNCCNFFEIENKIHRELFNKFFYLLNKSMDSAHYNYSCVASCRIEHYAKQSIYCNFREISVKIKLMVFFLIMMGGCASVPPDLVYPVGKRIVVTTGYDDYGRRAVGKDFAFSVILPPDEWSYYAKSTAASMGYLSPYGRNNRKELMIEWLWIIRDSAETQETLKETPYYLPWYSGVKSDGSRIFYTPTESQLRYGDWHRGGYSQIQFMQVVYKGKKPLYCVRTLTRRGGYTPPVKDYTLEYLAQTREGLYGVFDVCPFRTMDNKDAYFKVSVKFNVTAADIAANPQVIEDNLKSLDEWLKPMWDSVEIMPKAYQFEEPLANNKESQSDLLNPIK